MVTAIGGHSVDLDYLHDGVVIDVGARGFVFSDFFFDKKVYAIDPDPDVFKNRIPFSLLVLMNVAISDKRGESTYYRNGESTILTDIYQPYAHQYSLCKTITMNDVYDITGSNVDVLKLDCEAAEYVILGDGFRPIPKQITVEWHKHLVPEFHEKHIDKVMNNLLSCYDLVYAHESGMDNLFVRKW